MTVSHHQTGYSSCVKSTASRVRHASRTRCRVFVIALRTITIPLDIFPFHFFPSNFCETKFSEGISVHCSFQAHKNAYTFTLHRKHLYSPFFVADRAAFVDLSMKFLIFLNYLLCTSSQTLKFFLSEETQAVFILPWKKTQLKYFK